MAAVTFTNVLQNGDSTDSTTGYSTASWTPSADRLYILSIYATRQSGTAVQIDTPTGNGITWQSLAFRVSSNRVLSLWYGTSPSPSTGATSFTTSGVNHLGATWTISLASTDASLINPIVQTASSSGTATSGTVTLAAFADATNNATFGSFGANVNVAMATGTGFTNVGTRNQPLPNMAHLSEYVSGQDTSVDANWGVSVAWIGVAAEIAMATTTANTTNFFRMF